MQHAEWGGYDVAINVQCQIVTWFLPFVCRRIPKVMEIHFSHDGMKCNMRDAGRLYQWVYWNVIPHVFSRYDRFVVLSDEDSNYWKMNNVDVIENFSNCKTFPTNVAEKPQILCLARHAEQKRLDLLIDVWGKIHDKYPEWKVAVYGQESELTQTLQEKIERLGLYDSFSLNGAVANVEEKYAESEIFALTSEHEGFVLVLIEAMQASLPTCAFDVVPLKSIVEDGKTGYLAPFPDVDAFAANLSRLIEDAELRKTLGENGRKRAAEKWDIDVIMQKWRRLFEGLSRKTE